MKVEFVVKDGQSRIEIDLSEWQAKLEQVDQAIKDANAKAEQVKNATTELTQAINKWWIAVIGK